MHPPFDNAQASVGRGGRTAVGVWLGWSGGPFRCQHLARPLTHDDQGHANARHDTEDI